MSKHTESIHVIKRPLITEKSTDAAELNQYAFEVSIEANKSQIKTAIEDLYGVRVTAVNTQIRKGASFRNRYGTGQGSTTKRALVRVHADDSIDLF